MTAAAAEEPAVGDGREPRRLSAEDLAALAKKMPDTARQKWERAGRPVGRIPDDGPEQVRAEVRSRQRGLMADRFRRLVEESYDRFLDADLADLEPDQSPAKVRAWPASTSRILFLGGSNGRGKTHAAIALGFAFAARPASVELWGVPALMQELERWGETSPVLGRVARCDLLILDDLGTENLTGHNMGRLSQVIESRTSRSKARTVITTNLPWHWEGNKGPDHEPIAVAKEQSVVGRYGDRLADRLVDEAAFVMFRGRSWRRPAPY